MNTAQNEMIIKVEVWKTPSPDEQGGEDFYVIALAGRNDLILAAKGPFELADAKQVAADPDQFVEALFKEKAQVIWQESQFVKYRYDDFVRIDL
jgi:hypothetical protein